MSSRAMRKLHGNRDPIVIVPGLLNDSDDGNSGNEADEEKNTEHEFDLARSNKKKSKKGRDPPANPFLLLDENESNDEAEKEFSGGEEDRSECIGTGAKKKKRKKKKKQRTPDIGKENKDKEEDLDAAIQEMKEVYGDAHYQQETKSETAEYRALLGIERRNLNSDNEMRRIFGAKVVGSDMGNRRQRNRNRVHQRSTWLVQNKDNWSPIGKIGLSMEKRETLNGCHYFAFVHSHAYQQIQFKFLDAVESLNPENIVAVINIEPYHIDSLIQLSDVCRLSDDNQMAAELIEHALYAFECNFHPLFNVAQGNCRLDYRIQENRGFFLALFRHLITIGNKGCYRTALEFCKLLLSLDPNNDPLCVLLMVDFYALRSEQYSFLTRLYTEWEARRNLSQLPNFAYSYALALFRLSSREEGDLSQANEKLRYALLMFPMVLHQLLDKCSVAPDTDVLTSPLFSGHQYTGELDSLRMLSALYVERSYSVWKAAEVMEWLEANVRYILHNAARYGSLVKEYASKRSVRYKGCPHNIYRHLLISDLKGAKVSLPPHLAHSSILSYDPLPPSDGIVSYQRPPRPPRYATDAGILSMFFRSFLPNFDLPPAADGRPQAAEMPPFNEEGDDQATARATYDIRQNVGALMAAMRDLLSNIQPVPPPIENGENHDENDAEEDERDWEA